MRSRSSSVVAADRDPDAGADEDLAALDLERLVHRLEDPVGDLGDARLVDVLEQDDELVASEARGGVGGADAAEQPSRGLAQEHVAGGVAEAVVDVLERVEVDEQDRDPRVAPAPRAPGRARAGRSGAGGWAGR